MSKTKKKTPQKKAKEPSQKATHRLARGAGGKKKPPKVEEPSRSETLDAEGRTREEFEAGLRARAEEVISRHVPEASPEIRNRLVECVLAYWNRIPISEAIKQDVFFIGSVMRPDSKNMVLVGDSRDAYVQAGQWEETKERRVTKYKKEWEAIFRKIVLAELHVQGKTFSGKEELDFYYRFPLGNGGVLPGHLFDLIERQRQFLDGALQSARYGDIEVGGRILFTPPSKRPRAGYSPQAKTLVVEIADILKVARCAKATEDASFDIVVALGALEREQPSNDLSGEKYLVEGSERRKLLSLWRREIQDAEDETERITTTCNK